MEQYILSIINIQNKTPIYTLNKQLSFEKSNYIPVQF